MDLSQSLNLNTATQNKIFEPTYINLEYIFNKILKFFNSIFGSGPSSGTSSSANSSSFSFFEIFLFALALFFIFVICYCIVRMFEIRKKEKEYLEHELEEYAHHHKEKEKSANGFRNERWEHVLEYLASSNSSDWKLAVMEADSMLEDLTDQLELDGVNLGERLKSSNKEKFKTLDDAWEAHIVRNKIAHEGSMFELSQHEANRIITLYENVFREFGHI